MLPFTQTVSEKLTIFAAISIILMFIPLKSSGAETSEIGIVKSNRINVRSGPGRTKRSINILKKGAKFDIIGYDKGWIKMSFNGQIGYVRNRKRYVRIIKIKKKEVPLEKKKAIDQKVQIRKDISTVEEKAKTITKKIKKRQAEVETYTKKEVEIVSSLNDIERALNKTERRVSSLRSELAGVEEQIENTNTAIKALMIELRKSEDYASKRLVALYKLNLLGKIHVLASAESIYELMNRKISLERILNYDEQIIEGYMENKDRLSTLLDDFKNQKKERLSLKANLDAQIRTMSREKTNRAKVLTEIRNKKSLGLASIDFLKQAANALDQTIVTLRADFDKLMKITKKTLLDYKGLLKMPAKGTIVSFFGPYKNAKFNVKNFRSGIEIKSERGAPIRTVGDGQIVYASWFKGYGNMIIIDHGHNYYTVYAHAEELLKFKGNNVKAYEIIAKVGDTASMKGAVLYFEVRYHGKPMDPLEWLSKG